MCDLLFPTCGGSGGGASHELMPARPLGVPWAALVEDLPTEDLQSLEDFLAAVDGHGAGATRASHLGNSLLHYVALRNDDVALRALCAHAPATWVPVLARANLYGQRPRDVGEELGHADVVRAIDDLAAATAPPAPVELRPMGAGAGGEAPPGA